VPALLCIFCSVVILPVVHAATDSDSPEQTQLTERGAYRITIKPQIPGVPVAKLHNWIVHVETDAGEVFIPKQLVMMAGMPLHGHGQPSEPRVTKYLENGNFLVAGLNFSMTGLWHLVVNITGPAGPDRVLFEMNLRNAPIDVARIPEGWSVDDLRTLNSLWIDMLETQPKDVSNRLSGNSDAARLGKALFFDKKLSSPGTISCADCHNPRKHFTDGKALSFGTAQTARHSPSLIAAAYSQWFYWDGRRDSLWAQAVTPIETPGEMDNARVDAVRYVITHDKYGHEFSKLSDSAQLINIIDANRFPSGAGPYAIAQGKQKWHAMAENDKRAINRTFADIGKVLAAYVETLQHRPSRFDRFAEHLLGGNLKLANNTMTEEEQLGLKLFLNERRTPCLRCHNGPLFTNREFHNISTGLAPDGNLDFGRFIGLKAAMVDEFNCRGPYSDATRDQCDRLKHASEGHVDQGSFKVPSLRNVGVTSPYMHDGRLSHLSQVINHYRDPPDAGVFVHEISDFEITDEEASQLEAFLRTLTSIDEGESKSVVR